MKKLFKAACSLGCMVALAGGLGSAIAAEHAGSAAEHAGGAAKHANHGNEHAGDKAAMVEQACVGFGPQTPRDIDSRIGTNKIGFPMAKPAVEMNLCNIHFHNAAEHKAKAFSVVAKGDGKGYGNGFQCGISQSLTAAEQAPFANNACKGVEPGDTIEVHWVHSSCDVQPGEGLGACLSDKCANPSLRVETQVFTVVNNRSAMNFAEFRHGGINSNGKHQAATLPSGTGKPVEFLGSTTGPKYTEQSCSPLQVGWSVRPQCAKVDIATLSNWCADNPFNEDHAHGVRKLVTNPKLLSPIR